MHCYVCVPRLAIHHVVVDILFAMLFPDDYLGNMPRAILGKFFFLFSRFRYPYLVCTHGPTSAIVSWCEGVLISLFFKVTSVSSLDVAMQNLVSLQGCLKNCVSFRENQLKYLNL